MYVRECSKLHLAGVCGVGAYVDMCSCLEGPLEPLKQSLAC